MRHGKSLWDFDVSDEDRPLKERGINDAHLVSKKFKGENVSIDFAYSSPANRALYTAIIFLRNVNHDFKKFEINEDLYEFSGGGVRRFVENLDDQFNTVAIFGHNHAFTNLANSWGNRYIENLPTSGLVQIDFSVDEWKSISKGETTKMILPRQLK